MPKSPAIKGSALLVAHLHNRVELGMVWGCLAGAVFGVGFILDVDFFSGSAVNLVCGVLIGTSAVGAIFGHVMAGMLAKEVAVRKIHNSQLVSGCADLSEHKALKLQIHARHIALHVAPVSYAPIALLPEERGAIDTVIATHSAVA